MRLHVSTHYEALYYPSKNATLRVSFLTEYGHINSNAVETQLVWVGISEKRAHHIPLAEVSNNRYINRFLADCFGNNGMGIGFAAACITGM